MIHYKKDGPTKYSEKPQDWEDHPVRGGVCEWKAGDQCLMQKALLPCQYHTKYKTSLLLSLIVMGPFWTA